MPRVWPISGGALFRHQIVVTLASLYPLSLLANDAGYDPLEDRLRENIRSMIEAVFEEELAQFLGRSSLPAKSRCAKSMDGKPSIS